MPADRDGEPVRSYQSFSGELHCLSVWLLACRIDTVAMESTGVYLITLCEILEGHGIAVVVTDAGNVKHAPGRESDVNDS